MYFAQGLPFGFQAIALPVYLTRGGASLTGISFLSALSLPWLGKALWAPLVDRYGSASFGRRKSWIVPLQALLAATCLAAATLPSLPALLALVFLMNLFAATQDIAVDGLAVDLLGPAELGAGNAAQVVGYKLGMLAGGGLMLAASGWLGSWRPLFLIMAALMLGVLLVALRVREPTAAAATGERVTFAEVFGALRAALQQPGSTTLLIFLATYKLGELMVETMWKPYLVTAGFSNEFIGLAIGTVGLVFSIAGSLAGGWLASSVPIARALWITAAGRILPMVALVWISVVGPTAESVIVVTTLEHLFSGGLTTVVFAAMMARVDKRIGASHYTLLASIEVLGKLPGGWLSGPLASRLGFPAVFAIGTGLTIAFLGVLAGLARSSRQTA